MPEITVEASGEEELTQAVVRALRAWFDEAEIVSAAVRWPGQGAWDRLVERFVTPVSERLYRAGAAVVSGEALDRFLAGVRDRLTRQSTLIPDIQQAQQRYGDQAVDIDWTGASGDATPWRSRAGLIGRHEAQVTAMQAIMDSARPGDRKRWVHRGDDRVRSTHRAAGGQTVPVNEPFTVGTASLRYPGDPLGPAEEVLNCRCELEWITPAVREGEGNMSASTLSAAVTIDERAPLAPRSTQWDGDEARKKLRTWATNSSGELDEDKMARGFLWRTDGPPSDWKLPVATVVDGDLRLVWSGIHAAAAAVQGARSPIDLPESAISRIKTALNSLYRKAAREFDDDDIIPPWEREASLAASLSELDEVEQKRVALEASVRRHGGAWRPEASWFQPPMEADKERMKAGEQPLISDNGRVLGYVAPWLQPDGTPTLHLGYLDAGEYVPVPGQQNYGYFQQRNINYPLSDGTVGHVGVITDHGHPSQSDNPQHQAALVRVGEDDMGVWIAGAVFDDVYQDKMRFSRMKASAISGEWDLSTGTFRGAAMVNHPGFSQPLTREQDFYALAASMSANPDENVEQLAAAAETIVKAKEAIGLWYDTLKAHNVLVAQEYPGDHDDDGERENDREDSSDDRDDSELTEASVEFLQETRGHLAAHADLAQSYLDLSDDQRNERVSELARSVVEENREQVDAMERILSDAGKDLRAARTQETSSVPEDNGIDESDEPDKTSDVPVQLPEGLSEAWVRAARDILADGPTLEAAVKNYRKAPPGVKLPACLENLRAYLEENDKTSSYQARAAAVRSAEKICLSNEVEHAAIRSEACRAVAEYRAKMGAK